MAVVLVNASGRIAAVEVIRSGLIDPGHPLTTEIAELTGLTDQDLGGRSIDKGQVAEMLASCDGVVAYNAAFDRPFIEKMIDRHVPVQWGCAMADVPWRKLGFEPGPQGYALMQAGYYMPRAHRAKDDVLALVELLDHVCKDGETVMTKTLAAMEAPAWRFEAKGAPYGYKDDLREQRYRWAWGRLHNLWAKHVRAEAYQAELDWYVRTIGQQPAIVPLPASERYRFHTTWTPA
jgi:DNA polymerase-3 subunit epsilon